MMMMMTMISIMVIATDADNNADKVENGNDANINLEL